MGIHDESTEILQRADALKLPSLRRGHAAEPVDPPPRPPGVSAEPERSPRLSLKTHDARLLDAATARRAVALEAELFEAITAEDVALTNALLGVLPRPGAGAPAETLAETIAALTELNDLRLDLHQVSSMRSRRTWPDLGQALSWRLEVPPWTQYGVLSCDQALLDALLSAMLKEPAGGARRAFALTDRDRALSTFMVLRCLDALVTHHGAPPFTIAALAPSEEELEALKAEPSGVTQLVFLATTSQAVGFVRLFLPRVMVQRLVDGGVMAQAEVGGALLEARLEASVEIASLELEQRDLWGLSVGDVVLCARHGLGAEQRERLGLAEHQPSDDPPHGRLYLGQERALAVRLDVAQARSEWTASVASLDVIRLDLKDIEEKKKMSDVQEGGAGAPTSMSALAREAPVELQVRFGGVQMSVAEVASLQVGHVITLGVPIGQPVELVAGGSLVGRGELVNVDGQFGVRVLSRT